MTWVAVNFWFYAGAGLVVFALPYARPLEVVWLEEDGLGGRSVNGAIAVLKGLAVWAYAAMAPAFGVSIQGVLVVLGATALWHIVVGARRRAIWRWIEAHDGELQEERRHAIRIRTLLAIVCGVSCSFVALMVRLTFN